MTFSIPVKIGTHYVVPLPIKGLLVLGDSRSDEYQADDARGGAYSATTFNWLELLVRYRGVNCGPWGTRASPRRTGYEYNWALSASRMSDLIANGQHTGGAAQITSGLVSHCVIDIGANDATYWNSTYDEIYNSSLNDAGVAAKVSTMLSNYATVFDTLIAASSTIKISVANQSDRGQSPDFISRFPNAAGRQRVSDLWYAPVNSGLVTLASTRSANVSIINFASFSNVFLSGIDGSGFYHIGGQAIDAVNAGDEPHHFLLSDDEHVGTVLSGISANFWSAAINAAWGTLIAPFSDAEILANAGI